MKKIVSMCLCIMLIISIMVLSLSSSVHSQEVDDKVIITVETDLNRDGMGGGHLTYELHGKAAGDLRRAVLSKYDGLGPVAGAIDAVELKRGMEETPGSSYIADLEQALSGGHFYTFRIGSVDPLYENEGEDITVDVVGFVGVGDQVVFDDHTPIYIYLYFEAFSINDSENETDYGGEGFLDALYKPFEGNNAAYEIDLSDYEMEYNYNDGEEELGGLIPGFEVWTILLAATIAVGIMSVSKRRQQ